jgi:hypothetical protein
VTYAGGGGGMTFNNPPGGPGSGGAGGGGAGGKPNGINGTDTLGGGGGGCYEGFSGHAGRGGNGIVILRYLTGEETSPITFSCTPRVQVRGRYFVCNSTNATAEDWYSTDFLFTGNLTTKNVTIKATNPGYHSLVLIGTNDTGDFTIPSGTRYLWIPKPIPGIPEPTTTPIPIPPGLVVLALAFAFALNRGGA